MSGATLAARVTARAAGCLAAQRFIFDLHEGRADPGHARSRLREVEIEFGVDGEATEGFLIEPAKRCR